MLGDALVLGSNDGRRGVLAAEADEGSVHAQPQLEARYLGLLHLLGERFREKQRRGRLPTSGDLVRVVRSFGRGDGCGEWRGLLLCCGHGALRCDGPIERG
jgi:hypothetical protein